MSLDRKLPLIMAGLLLAVMLVLAVATYVEMRRTALSVASERLASVTTQLRDLFANSGTQQRAGIAAVASQLGVVAFASTSAPTAAQRARALRELAFVNTNPDQVVATELRSASGRVLLTTAPAGYGLGAMALGDVLPSTEPGDSGVIGNFRLLRDTIVFPVARSVPGTDDVYVVRWRRLSMTPRTRENITRILGTYGAPYLGNPGGETWVDFEKAVPALPYDFANREPVQRYVRDGAEHLASAAAVAGTPWVMAMDVPMSVVMQPATLFFQRMSLLALVALAVALLAVRAVSKRLTRPLVHLTDAASRIAAGDYTQRVHVNRADELGRLGQAFTVMATEVRNTRDQLEHRVDERTRELHEAMGQLRDAQDALVRREKLAMLGQLASGVGHELRNPLGVMTNSVYYLRMVLEAQPANVKEYLDILQQQITLSEKIVSDLLDFARQRPPQRNPASIAEVSDSQMKRLGTTDGVRVVSELNGTLPPVLVDQVQVGQVIFNLLTNAVQALDGAGQVTIRARADDGRVVVQVQDTGPGVPAEHMEKVFEPLFTTKARGIGLGLAVSRALARANEGDLTVGNASAGGAVFTLTLPVARDV